MALLDIFTGQPAIDAAAQQRAYLGQVTGAGLGAIGAAGTTGLGALQSGQYGALGALGTGYTGATGAISQYSPMAIDALRSGQTGALGALYGAQPDALAALRSGVTSAVGAYNPLTALAGRYGGYSDPAASMTADALGLNGPAGSAAATGAFRTSPGYQFQLDQGIDAITRAQNAVGMGASGNTLRQAQTYGSGLADQEYQNWLKNLTGIQQLYAPLQSSTTGQAAGGQASAYLTGGTGGANIYTGTGQQAAGVYGQGGRDLSGLYTGTGGSLASLASGYGTGQAGIYTGTGQNVADLSKGLAGLTTGLYGQVAGPYAGTYGTEAQGQLQGSGNIWNLVGGAAQLASGLGYLPGGGAIGKSVATPFFNFKA